MSLETDVLVVGGGLAGLMAALQVSPRRVVVASKVYPTQSHSGAAQGGFNAAMTPSDSVEAHVADTIKGSDYLADQEAVEVMCEEAPEVIRELDRLGAMWSRSNEGAIAQRRLGGSSHARACYAADMSGHIALQTLYEQTLRHRIPLLVEWHLLALLVEEERIAGGVFWNLPGGRLEVVRSTAVILATGGYGRIYSKTTNGLGSTGDGVAIAYRVGAVLSDMEFVQFHPTTLVGTNILISEGARGEGGQLRNASGERFMRRYAPAAMELAPRDLVSRAITMEIRQGRGINGTHVHLDIAHLGEEVIEARLPQVLRLGRIYAAVDATRQPLPIEPAQHYSMGGIRTDTWGQTGIAGLFAAGECANVSVHGANRLGGNSLLETVVFGRRAGRRAAEWVAAEAPAPAPERSLRDFDDGWRTGFDSSADARGVAMRDADLRHRLTNAMTDKVGVFRSGRELEDAVRQVRALQEEYARLRPAPPLGPFDYRLVTHQETGFLLDVAEVVAVSALRRGESRGAHARADAPERDDDRWLAHTFAQRTEAGPRLWSQPVDVGKYAPQQRAY